jgi:hypothetical protein
MGSVPTRANAAANGAGAEPTLSIALNDSIGSKRSIYSNRLKGSAGGWTLGFFSRRDFSPLAVR